MFNALQIDSFNPLYNLKSWVLLQTRKLRLRAVCLRQTSTKRKAGLHTKAVKLQSLVMLTTPTLLNLINDFCKKCFAGVILSNAQKAPWSRYSLLQRFNSGNWGPEKWVHSQFSKQQSQDWISGLAVLRVHTHSILPYPTCHNVFYKVPVHLAQHLIARCTRDSQRGIWDTGGLQNSHHPSGLQLQFRKGISTEKG